MSDDSYQRAINEVRALREHQKGDSLPDEREIISALRTAQYESRPIFEAADAFDAVKPFLVTRDVEIERLIRINQAEHDTSIAAQSEGHALRAEIARLKEALQSCRTNAHNDWTVREIVNAALEQTEGL